MPWESATSCVACSVAGGFGIAARRTRELEALADSLAALTVELIAQDGSQPRLPA